MGAFAECLAAGRPLIDIVWLREIKAHAIDTPERRAAFEAGAASQVNPKQLASVLEFALEVGVVAVPEGELLARDDLDEQLDQQIGRAVKKGVRVIELTEGRIVRDQLPYAEHLYT